MKTPLIKICGNTNPDDGRVALECGADMLGFIFYDKSPRYVTPDIAGTINDSLKKKFQYHSVGVFVNPSEEFVEDVISTVEIDILQFHGDESVSFIKDIKSFNKKIIKAFRIKNKNDLLKCDEYDSADFFLLDTFSRDAFGGTGKTFDWTILDNFKYKYKLFLSGGIGTGNVRVAVNIIKPYAIDLSSSLEKEPGIKDHKKIREFFREIKNMTS